MEFRRLGRELVELSEWTRAGLRRRLRPPRVGARAALHRAYRAFDGRALARRPLAEAPVVVIDTETTGLQPYGGDRIVEIALLAYRGLVPTGRAFYSRVHPGRPVPSESTHIHGLTDMDLADAPSLERIVDDVLGFLSGAVIVGHHVGFDLRFLNRAALRHISYRIPNPAVNTMVLFQAWSGRRHACGLDEAAAACGVRVPGRHNAHDDAATCGALFRFLAPRLCPANATVADLLAVTPPRPVYGPGAAAPRPPHS